MTLCVMPKCYRQCIKRNGHLTCFCEMHLCEHGNCNKPVSGTPLTTTARRMYPGLHLCEFHVGWLIGATIHAWKLDEHQKLADRALERWEQERRRYMLEEDEQA